jgi:hypothetical protein
VFSLPLRPHPSFFDVLCTIENRFDAAIQNGDLFAVTTVEFIVAPTDVYSGDVDLNGGT